MLIVLKYKNVQYNGLFSSAATGNKNNISSIKSRQQIMSSVRTSPYIYTRSLKWSLKLPSFEMSDRYISPDFYGKLLATPSIKKSSSNCIFYPADGGTSYYLYTKLLNVTPPNILL
jgi:hypothetical protein